VSILLWFSVAGAFRNEKGSAVYAVISPDYRNRTLKASCDWWKVRIVFQFIAHTLYRLGWRAGFPLWYATGISTVPLGRRLILVCLVLRIFPLVSLEAAAARIAPIVKARCWGGGISFSVTAKNGILC